MLGNIDDTDRPRVYALGGAKAEDSIHVAERVLEAGLADEVLTMGVVGNLFLSAAGTYLGEGSSAVLDEFEVTGYTDRAAALLEAYPDRIRVPVDLAVDRDGDRAVVAVVDLPVEAPALDIGPATCADYAERLEAAGAAILNGPAGVAERPAFAEGTREVYEAATRARTSIVGGGDTAAALRGLEISGFTHWSTGGGASMRMLAGDPLPAVEALRDAG